MGNTFSKIFLPIFSAVLLLPIIVVCAYPRLLHRSRNRVRSDSLELTYVSANSANINRLSASCFPPHPTVRPFTTVPLSARSARRREHLSQELQNPFIDPPHQNNLVSSLHNRSVATFHTRSATSIHTIVTGDLPHRAVVSYSPLADDNCTPPNFSTPTRQNRFSSSIQHLTPYCSVRSTAPTNSNSSAGTIPVPERAFLRSAKPFSPAPSLYQTLAKFPIPPSAPAPMLLAPSSSSHRHLHPNKLFQSLSSMAETPSRSKNPTTTVTTDTATTSSQPVSPIAHTSSPIKLDSFPDEAFTSSSPISSMHCVEDGLPQSPANEPDPTPLLAVEMGSSGTTKPKPNLNITISPPSSSSANNLTSTGAKTPVSTIREIFDRKASDPIFPVVAVAQGAVPSALAVPVGRNCRASSIYSRDSTGVPVLPRLESVSSLDLVGSGSGKVAEKPMGRAPGGAEWI